MKSASRDQSNIQLNVPSSNNQLKYKLENLNRFCLFTNQTTTTTTITNTEKKM